MKKTMLFVYCMMVMLQSFSQQVSCNDEMIMNKQGSWNKRADANTYPDVNFPKSQFAQANIRIDKMQSLLQAAYPFPKGIEAGWYRGISGKALVKGGAVPYGLNAMLSPYFCNSNKMQLADESGTWLYVWANQFNWFAEYISEFLIKQQPVYLLTQRDGEINGFAVYKGQHNEHSNTGIKYSRAVIITRNGQSPYIPVTKKEYLKAFILFNGKKLPEALAGIEKGFIVKTDALEEDAKQKALESIAKNYSANVVERRKTEFLKNYKTDKQQKEEWLAKTKKSYQDIMKPVQDILENSTDQDLEQPAIIDNVDFLKFNGFSSEAKSGRQLVYLNPSYFNNALPKYIPQLLIVYWRWNKAVAPENFKNQFEASFDFNALKAMIDQ